MPDNAAELNKTKDPDKFHVRADLHVHTVYSADSLITPKELVFYAKKNGLTAVAVTDHNRIEGALKIAKETDFPIIPGIEVSSKDGHIVGLNVTEVIPRGLSAEVTVDKIHKAGGVAIACHPYALFKGSIGKNVSAKFDAIETINARAFPFGRSRRKAEEIAKSLGLPRVGGTDAHYGPQIGYGYTIIDSEPNIEAIAKAIVNGQCQPSGKPVPLILNIKQEYQRLLRYKTTFRKNSDKNI
jgi:predicted metal-dependent phosphoesterase TrpH